MTAVMPTYTISARVRGVWKKLSDWYGADEITKKIGALPPQDWCQSIDSLMTREQLQRVMNEVQHAHVKWPPRFPEFDAIVQRVLRPAPSGPAMQDQLTEYLLRTKRITFRQDRGKQFLWRGDVRSGAGFEIVGVLVPADGDIPAFRVMVEDLALSTSP